MFFSPPQKWAACALFLYLKIKGPLFCCPLLQRTFQYPGQDQQNCTRTWCWLPSSALSSRINPFIFLQTPQCIISIQNICWFFFSNLYVVGGIFKFMVLRLLGNAFVSQKIESSHLYSYHPCKTPPCRKKGNCAQRCVIKGIYLNNISYIAPVSKPNHSQLTWLATVFPVIETNPLSVDTLWLQPHYQIEEIFIGHCRTTWYWWKFASLVINTSRLLLAFLRVFTSCDLIKIKYGECFPEKQAKLHAKFIFFRVINFNTKIKPLNTQFLQKFVMT